MIFKKGHKSNALRLFGFILAIIASSAVVAYFLNNSTEQTNRVSYKAAGLKYKEQYTVADLLSLPVNLIEEKQHKKTYLLSGRSDESQNSKNKHNLASETQQSVQQLLTNFFQAVEDEKPTNSSLARETKQPNAVDMAEMSSDLQVLSSFDCVKSIPTVLLDYISTLFLNEYGKSHDDFHSQNSIDEAIPLLKQFNINCGVGQNCSTMFQYDKQYGIDTTADNTFLREDVFYCCPSVHSSTNETISNICKRGQTVTGKSVFRESKDSTFMGRVIELSTYNLFLIPLCRIGYATFSELMSAYGS